MKYDIHIHLPEPAVTVPHDIPVNTVTTKYHDEITQMYRDENAGLNAQLKALREQCRCLKAEKTDLLDTLDSATSPEKEGIATPDLSDKIDELNKPKTLTHRSFKAGAKTKKGTPRTNNTLLENAQVWAIRRFDSMGREAVWIAKHLDIPYATVHKVATGLTYGSVPAEPERKPVALHAGHGVI